MQLNHSTRTQFMEADSDSVFVFMPAVVNMHNIFKISSSI